MYPRIIHYCLPGVIVGLQQTSYTVGEGNGSLSACTFLNGETQREVIVSLSTEQGSAQGITSSLNILSMLHVFCKLSPLSDILCHDILNY